MVMGSGEMVVKDELDKSMPERPDLAVQDRRDRQRPDDNRRGRRPRGRIRRPDGRPDSMIAGTPAGESGDRMRSGGGDRPGQPGGGQRPGGRPGQVGGGRFYRPGGPSSGGERKSEPRGERRPERQREKPAEGGGSVPSSPEDKKG